MKIIVKESQIQKLKEGFSFEDLKNRFNYIFNLDKKKHGGADSFYRYQMILAFQKYVDLLYKYAKKDVKFDGVTGMNVATVWVKPWGENFSQPDLPPSRLDYFVRIFPNINEDNPPISQKTFDEQYSNFQNVFEDYSKGMGMEMIQPVQDKQTKNIKIKYDFLNLKIENKISEMVEGKDFNQVTCKNCNKRFTQTIHKNKKSTLECPHCGTHNSENSWGNSSQKLSKEFKFNDFEDAISFVNKVAKIAEKQNHHPDIVVNYNKVKISITDHDKGRVSEKCHRFVNAVDKIGKLPESTELTERCWKGYTQKGMKTMFGKRYPNCVKKTK